MKVIKKKTLMDLAIRSKRQGAREKAEKWHSTTEDADWKNFQDVKQSFPQADTAKVKSGSTVYIFDILSLRLICAIHFNKGRVFVLRLMSHEEYDENKWKNQL